MTRILYRRDSVFMQVMSTVVAFAFALSIAGPGIATPAVPEVESSEVVTSELVVASESEISSDESAENELSPDSLVEDEPAAAPEAESTEPSADEPMLAMGFSTSSMDEPVVAASTAPYASFQTVGWQAYRISPASQVGWAQSNLGKYREGDWIPVRIYVDNTKGTSELRLPAFDISFDHYNSNRNAIAVDKVRGYAWHTGNSLPTGPMAPAGAIPLPGFTATPAGSSPTLDISFSPVGDVVIPQGHYGVINLEVHLALTQYWQTQTPARFGAKEYPGSSAQGRFITWNGTGTGNKTISVPVGSSATPEGRINGVKFNDLNRNGVRDSGEPGLSGWVFTLVYSGDFPFTEQATSAADGTFSFTELPAGSYTITETLQSPWVNSTPNPVVLELDRDEVKSVIFGNYIPDVIKTWTLSIDTLPMGASAYVTYKVNGVAGSTTLSGPPYTAAIDVPTGASITDIEWFVSYGGEEISLGTMADEVLNANKTNTFTYDSSVAGMKFHDLNGDGIKDAGEPGLSGWTIVLKRVVSSVETTYAQTITSGDGTYSFADVLPGTYKVYEVNQSGWYNTVAPIGSFTVGNNVHVSDKDFGNLELMSSLLVEKTGPVMAHVGDLINYSIVVTNTGNYTLSNVLVTDAMLGVSQTIPLLAAGDSVTINASYTVLANDPDPLPNTAYALGTDILGTPVAGQDSHLVDILKPGINLLKSVAPEMAVNPANVLYTYVVTNSGEETLTSVALSDDKLSVPGAAIGTLTPGEVVTLTASAVLTTSTTNVAEVVGTDALGLEVDAADTAHVDIYNPSISIAKSAESTVTLPGSLVSYAYLVTNTGDIALYDIVVTDDLLGPIATIPMLAPGAYATVSATSTLSEDTTNIGTATGKYGTVDTDFFGTVTDSSSAFVGVVDPAVQLIKTGAPKPVVVGDTVTYSYLVRNTGDVALYDLVVTDDLLGSIGTVPMLAVGAEYTLQATSVLTTSTTNVGTVNGYDAYQHPVSDTDTETVLVYAPAISIDKSVDSETVLEGTVVTYTYLVTNAGDIELSDIAVTDDKIGAIGTIASLAPGASASVTATAAITADTTNVGTAMGYYGEADTDFFGSVSDTDDAFVDVIAPSVQIIKSAAPETAVAGTEITYSYLIKNTGDVTLYDLVVTDDLLGEIGTVAELAAGAEATLTATSVLTETTTNIVVVEGTDEFDNPVTDTDELTVDIYNPGISIVKTASSDVILAGGIVTYTYLVTNTGDIALTDIQVTDDVIGPIATIPMLAPGAFVPVTAPVAVFEDTVNIGTATGTYGMIDTDFYGTVQASDDAFVDVVAPAMSVVKTGSPNPALAGTEIAYTYVVSNDGDVELIDIELVDDKLGAVGTLESLAVGASYTFTVTEPLTETTVNVVTATATDVYENPVTATDSETVQIFDPAVSVVKTVDQTVVLSGETVVYTYVVTNTGDIELTDVTLSDDMLGALGNLGTLLPEQSVTVTAAAEILVDTTNIATVVGDYGVAETQFAGQVSDTDDAFVDVVAPAIDVVKTASPTEIIAGESVVYTYTVFNTGDVPLNDVVLTDDKLGAIGSLPTLAVGSNAQFSASASLTESTLNIVEAVAVDDFGHVVSATDDAFVDVALPFTPPNLEIDKSADKTTARAGETVRYTLTYRNTGEGAASTFTIVDDFDERYMTVVDASGGTVANGTITWEFTEPLPAGSEARTLSYTLRIADDLPASVRSIRNTALITTPGDPDPDSDTWTVTVPETTEPFLPFTGGGLMLIVAAALLAVMAGTLLRRSSRRMEAQA